MQVVGVLHADHVTDGDMTVRVCSDGEGTPPILVSFRADQAVMVRRGLCHQVTVHGELQVADGITRLILHHLDISNR